MSGPAPAVPAGRPNPVEWAGWGLLAALSLLILLLAVLRPTHPDAILNEIRLAAGFDRYQAAIDEGDRLYSAATAGSRLSRPGDHTVEYRMLAEAAERFQLARREAEGFAEDQKAQLRLLEVYHVWARTLYREGAGEWYERDDALLLREALELVAQGLALPHITGEQRSRMEALQRRIERSLRWPIL